MKKKLITGIAATLALVVLGAAHAFAAVTTSTVVVTTAANQITINLVAVGTNQAELDADAGINGGVTIKVGKIVNSFNFDSQTLPYSAGTDISADYPGQAAVQFSFTLPAQPVIYTSGDQYYFKITSASGTTSFGQHQFTATGGGSVQPSVTITPTTFTDSANVALTVNGDLTQNYGFSLDYYPTADSSNPAHSSLCQYKYSQQAFTGSTEPKTCIFSLANLTPATSYSYQLTTNQSVDTSAWKGTFDTKSATVTGSTQGICGNANGQLVTTAPSVPTDLCSQGTPVHAPVSSGTGWAWTCSGTPETPCYTIGAGSGNNNATNSHDCGSADGTVVESEPTTGLCQTWATLTSQPRLDPADQTWSWMCVDTGTGSTSSCGTDPAPRSTECGIADGQPSTTTAPANADLCQSWATATAGPTKDTSNDAQAGTWGWTCSDQGTGNSSQCGTAPTGACGSIAGTSTTTQPSGAGLCDSGTAGTVTLDANNQFWNWTCGVAPCQADDATESGGHGCGAMDGQPSPATTPTTDLCITGSQASVPEKDSQDSNSWGWTCTDTIGNVSVCGTAGAPGGGTNGNQNSNPSLFQNPFKNLDTFPKILTAVMNNIVLPIAIPFIAIMIMYSGFLFIVARKTGKVYSLEKAKTTFMYTMIGAAIILGAFVIGNALQGTINALTSMLIHFTTIA